MPSSDKWSPSPKGIRDPRDAKKKNGMFWNWTRYLYFGGAPGADRYSGSHAPNVAPKAGDNTVGPISDRGKGR